MTRGRELRYKRCGGLILNIEKGYARALGRALGNEGLADAGGAAGDEDAAVFQTRIAGVFGFHFDEGILLLNATLALLHALLCESVGRGVKDDGEGDEHGGEVG